MDTIIIIAFRIKLLTLKIKIMQRRSFLALFFCCFLFQTAFSQRTNQYRWWNPEQNPFSVIEGRGWHDKLAHPYDRLPAKAERIVREPVWNKSHSSAGLMIRFSSNTRDIRVRYTVGGRLGGGRSGFSHMPYTGVSGVDLYSVNKDGVWEWNAGKRKFGDTIEYHFASLNHDYVKEYHLYLPLYNNVKWLEIGIPDTAGVIMTPLPVRSEKPIVIYGTSVAQGGVASRPGMAFTAILGRRLHRPLINLGFSGEGKLEKPVIELLTEIDAKVFILACFGNLFKFPTDTVKSRLIESVKILQKKRPSVPILIAERGAYNKWLNEIARSTFAEMKAAGVRNIFLLTSDQIGLDINSTVDGAHPNDYGMVKLASAYEKVYRNMFHEPVGE